jgi:hypothetical protein
VTGNSDEQPEAALASQASSPAMTHEDVLDAIAIIELQRQEMHRESDPAAWRSRAVARLREIQQHLAEVAQRQGQAAVHPATVAALAKAISRIEGGAKAAATRRMQTADPAGRPGERRRQRSRSKGKQCKNARYGENRKRN